MMTDALGLLGSTAKPLGFENLFARVRKDNMASLKVLERNGFHCVGDWPEETTRARYELSLET